MSDTKLGVFVVPAALVSGTDSGILVWYQDVEDELSSALFEETLCEDPSSRARDRLEPRYQPTRALCYVRYAWSYEVRNVAMRHTLLLGALVCAVWCYGVWGTEAWKVLWGVGY
eukprot:2616123-Rhodomonas_salina.1